MKSVIIAGLEVQRIEYRGQSVVTYAIIDRVHGRVDGTAKRTVSENRERFIPGEDLIIITADQRDEFRTFGIEVPNRGMTLVTRRGYLKITKSLNDDKAWSVFEEMVDRYFAIEALQSGEVDVASISKEAKTVIGGIVKSIVHKELSDAISELLPQMVRAQLSEKTTAVRRGRTAGQIWNEYHLPPLKNAALWLGHRLTEMGCSLDGGGRAELGDRSARLFDPDRASACMRNGLLDKCRKYVSERSGQLTLKLVTR